MSYAPIITLSALTGKRVDDLFEVINKVYEANNFRVNTSVLNEIIMETVAITPPPTDKGKRLKIYYGTEVKANPPTFVLFVNDKDLAHFSYIRHMENAFRKYFDLEGTPINIIVRERNTDKYVGAVTQKVITKGINKPQFDGFVEDRTYYVLYDNEGNMRIGNKVKTDGSNIPNNWYDYADGKWANIVVTDGRIENGQIVDATTTSYFVWIPRYQYLLNPATQRANIKFIDGIGTDTEFGYKIPEAFTWINGNETKQLYGYWISKYELSGSATLQANGDTPVDKNRNTWMTEIRKMEGLGGTLGLIETQNGDLTSSSGSNNLDIHMQKNTEYGAMALLSASSYGKTTKIENGETTTGNETGVVIPYNYEWTAAQATEYYGTTGYNSRYINYYSANSYEQKAGDAMIETQGWHGTTYKYSTKRAHPNISWHYYSMPGGIARILGSGIFAYSNSLFDSGSSNSSDVDWYMLQHYPGGGALDLNYKSRAVIVNGEGL